MSDKPTKELVAWLNTGSCQKCCDMCEAAAARLEALAQRLEIYPYDSDGNQLSEELPESCDGIACRDETIAELEQQRDKVGRLLNTVTANRRTLARSVRRKNGQLETFRAERAALERERDEAEKAWGEDIELWRQKYDAARAARDEWADELKKAHAREPILHRQRDGLRAEVERLTNQCDELLDDRTEADAEVERLNGRLSRLTGELRNAKPAGYVEAK